MTSNRRDFILGITSVGVAASSVSDLVRAAGPLRNFTPKRWWTHEYRIVQTNLREIDARENPREIARAVRDFGANVLVTNIGGIVAFYPTKLSLQYRNPYLSTDFAGEMIHAAKAEGLAVIGRFDLSKAMKPAYDAHPDWFMLNRDGTPREYAGTYQACPNGGWAQSYGREILAEAVKAYPTDGLFFNMTGYPETDYSNINHGTCVCDNCRRRFKEMYNLELPKTEGFKDPNWIPYLEFQTRTSEELLRNTNAFIAKIRNVPVTAYLRYDVVGRGEVQRRVYRSPPEWPYQAGEHCRTTIARNPGKPFSATSAAHVDYPWRQVTETADCHLLRFAQELGVGAKLDLYLMGTIQDQDDPSYLPPLSKLYKWHAEHESDYAGLVPSARIGLYQSDLNTQFGGATPWAKYMTGAFRGAYMALADSRLPFWMVNDGRVADGTTKLAGNYDAIILPHVALISDAEAAQLDAFVAAGGLLITTGLAGAFDTKAQQRSQVALASFPGTAFGTALDAHGWSADLSKGEFSFDQGRMAITGHYFPVTPRADARTLLSLAPDQRFGPPELSYAIPGDAPRPDPVVLARTHGSGMAVHVPWLPDWQYYRDGMAEHLALIEAIIRKFTPAAPFLLEGSGAVELMSMRQPATGRTLLHIINYAGQRNGYYGEAPMIGGLRLGIRGTERPPVRSLLANIELAPSTTQGKVGYVWFDVPPLKAFDAIQIG